MIFCFRYREQVLGISPADLSSHQTLVDLDPVLGGTLSIKARFQMNLVLERDSAFPPLEKLPVGKWIMQSSLADNLTHVYYNSILTKVTVLPLFWVEEGFDAPDKTR